MDARSDTRRMVSALTAPLDVERELDWFTELLDARLKSYFEPETLLNFGELLLTAPGLDDASATGYSQLVGLLGLDAVERALLILALIPYLRPQLLDVLWSKNDATGRGFTEFGGLSGNSHGGFLPTAETALFILSGDRISERLRLMHWMRNHSRVIGAGIVQLGLAQANEPWTSGQLQISREYVDQLVHGATYRPVFGIEFPARRIENALDWSDLVLPPSLIEQLDEIHDWIRHGERLLSDWGMRGKLAPGFTCLFHGPSGTGKTMSASLLGKRCGVDVYKVDLSAIVSKYIGETEKNMARIFDAAENQGWILFFDEADALFGKRTRVDDSHDRYANQEISFLLQRIEEFRGVIILASNIKSNIDDAFIRRFQSVIQFPMPKHNERQRIWSNAFSGRCSLEEGINLAQLAARHEVSGGTIMNVVRFASLRALGRDSETILLDDIEEGLRREKLKEGRTL